MRNTFSKGLIGVKYDDFLTSFTGDGNTPAEIVANPARLIPIGRKDDEMALTSVFLASLPLIVEFRNVISETMKLSKAGKIYCFTEVSFPVLFSEDKAKANARFDGLAIVVSAGTIKDAAIFEMKSGSDELNQTQIELYVDMAHSLAVTKFMSVTNQFVPSESIYPIPLNIPRKNKDVALFHSSWKRIRTIASILVQKNNLNIEDSDQVSIMKEVLRYMDDCGSIRSFDKMRKEWKEVVADLGSSSGALNSKLKEFYPLIIQDWLQEERDIAIDLTEQLSEHEYTPVFADSKKSPSMNELIKNSIPLLRDQRKLCSSFKIKNAVSNLSLTADLMAKNIMQSMTVQVPQDKNTKTKLNYVRGFFKKSEKANPEAFSLIKENIQVNLILKRKQEILKFPLVDFMDADKTNIDKALEIAKVDVCFETNLKKSDFESSSKFISIMENAVSKFYSVVMQYFEKWVPTTPKTSNNPVSAEATLKDKQEVESDENDEQGVN